jgi:predicted metal-dependent peptidase
MTNQTTSNGIRKKIKVSQQKIDDFDLQKYLVSLLWDEPFYSRILRSLNKVESDQVPTAGVLCKDGDLTMWWNREFLASLAPCEVKGLLKHECLHLVFKHTTERRKEPFLLWNYSADLAINSIIPRNELPDGGLVPGEKLEKLSVEDKKEMSSEAVKCYESLSLLIEKLPKNKTSEFYFDKLMSDPNIKSYAEKCEGEGSISIGFDDHDGWDDMSSEEREMMKEKLGQLLKDAVQESNSNGWGSISVETAIKLNKMISNEIKWEDILRRFCGFTRRDDRLSTNKRLNRKYPGIHPGAKKIYKPRVAVYVDESGSMRASDLEKFYGELNSLSTRTDFYMYKFDSNVDDKNGFLWKKGKRLNISRSKSGGTCFEVVTKHAIKNKKDFDGYIVFTDGCAAKPSISHGLKRCWLVLPDYTLAFKKDKKDILIQMKN